MAWVIVPLAILGFLAWGRWRGGPFDAGSWVSERHTCLVLKLLVADRWSEAAKRVGGRSSRVHPAMIALVKVLHGDQAAREELSASADEPHTDIWRSSAKLLLRVHEQDWPSAHGMIDTSYGFKVGAVQLAMYWPYRADRFLSAAEFGQHMLDKMPPGPRWAFTSYNTACCWARAGETAKAFAALQRAVVDGWSDLAHLDQDEDLTAVRAMPAFAEWRRGVGPAPA